MEETKLYLIRHGETRDAHERRYKGTIDVPLSDAGRSQLATVAETLASIPLAGLYASDLSRAVESAAIIGKPHGYFPSVVPAFRERHFGRWEGLTFEECSERFPEEFEAWVRNPLDAAPLGGETTREVHRRVVPALEKLIDRHRGENFAVISHGGVNRIVLSHVLGLPLENIFRIEQDFAALNIIEFNGGFAGVRLMNGVLSK